ncbi:MAG: hypothetical protein JNL21_00835 [Myxococcales bacterium]|nr:hypothetical protein [Myxococcales bacterium]
MPLLDEPNHLAAITIFHDLARPGKNLSPYYDAELRLVPYLSYHLLVHLFAFATGVEWANKIVLCAYVLSVPAAALWWTRRTQRGPWLALTTFPLAFSTSWAFGFHPFNVAIGLFLLASASVDALLERSTLGRTLVAGLLSVGCALGHPLAAVALAATTVVLFGVHRPRPARAARALLALGPAAALFLCSTLRPSVDWVQPRAGAGGLEVKRLSIDTLLRRLPEHTLDPISGKVDTSVFWALVVCTAGLLLVDLVQAQPIRSPRAQLLHHRAALLGLAMAALYVAIPFEIVRPFAWWWVGLRFAPLAFFFFLLVPSGTMNRLRIPMNVAGVACAFVLPLHVSEKYAEFDARMAPFVRMVESTPEGASILCLRMGPRTDAAVNVTVYDQIGAWVQILRGGYSQAGWHDTATLFRTKRALPAPPYWHHEQFDPKVHAAPYDFVLVHREPQPLFTDEDGFRLAAREGEWRLYERVTVSRPEQHARLGAAHASPP